MLNCLHLNLSIKSICHRFTKVNDFQHLQQKAGMKDQIQCFHAFGENVFDQQKNRIYETAS